jgi:hypothetical protein
LITFGSEKKILLSNFKILEKALFDWTFFGQIRLVQKISCKNQIPKVLNYDFNFVMIPIFYLLLGFAIQLELWVFEITKNRLKMTIFLTKRSKSFSLLVLRNYIVKNTNNRNVFFDNIVSYNLKTLKALKTLKQKVSLY